MCEIREKLCQLEYMIGRGQDIIATRCAYVHYMMFSTQISIKDLDFLTLLASLLITGQDEGRVEFRRLGYGKIISKIMQKSHANLLAYENCLKFLDTATDGKPENIVPLSKDNDVLIHEIQYALRCLASTSVISEKMINIMTKLFKADKSSAKWMINDETQKQIHVLPEHHGNVATNQSACNQLEMLLKYSSQKDNVANC